MKFEYNENKSQINKEKHGKCLTKINDIKVGLKIAI